MSRRNPLPVELPGADPSPGRWITTGSRVYAFDDATQTETLIANCELPGSNLDRELPNLDQVERTRRTAAANARTMRAGKEALQLLNEARLRLQAVPHAGDLINRIDKLIAKARG